MNIAYPVSEILKCVKIINQPKKKSYNNSDKKFNLNNIANMKKKIKQTQGTFGEIIETEEFVEETFDNAKPFEIDEITKIDNSKVKKNKKEKERDKLTIKVKKYCLIVLSILTICSISATQIQCSYIRISQQ